MVSFFQGDGKQFISHANDAIYIQRTEKCDFFVSSAHHKKHHASPFNQFDNLASLPFAYTFYILTIITRVCIILGREFSHNHFKDYDEHDRESVLAIVASTGWLSFLEYRMT